jgi:transposase
MGRPSIPPENLLRAMLLQVFYAIRSERQLMERLEFDLLFRWCVGMGVDAWDHSTCPRTASRCWRAISPRSCERGDGATAGEAPA